MLIGKYYTATDIDYLGRCCLQGGGVIIHKNVLLIELNQRCIFCPTHQESSLFCKNREEILNKLRRNLFQQIKKPEKISKKNVHFEVISVIENGIFIEIDEQDSY